jgi:predicted RNA-binding Zn ribbon-like protein
VATSRFTPYTLVERYPCIVYVTSGQDTEIRLTLEAMVDLVNALADAGAGGDPADLRALLGEHGFVRATDSPAASLSRIEQRLSELSDRLRTLADDDTDPSWINAALGDLDISPSIVAHDGSGLHIHWTPPSAPFDDQVVADILMALAQEICDHGTERFGRCAAVDCDHVFYDVTRNRSRRFCSDPRCASRTHTADHRARRRARRPRP